MEKNGAKFQQNLNEVRLLDSYKNVQKIILEENARSLKSVESEDVENAIDLILNADKVFVIGVGRVLLMLQAFVKRLNHLGIKAYYVGEINEPPITKKDLLIVGSGSGESVVPIAIANVAKKYKVNILYIGSNLSSSIGKIADSKIRIPCPTKLKLKDELPSMQPMSTLFEQSLLLLCDIIAYMILKRKNIDLDLLEQYHANLE